MVKYSLHIGFLMVISGFLLVSESCRKESPDETPPEINNLMVNNTPDSAAMQAGNTAIVSFLATDDHQLLQYKISIASAFSGFTYRNIPLARTFIGSLAGTSQTTEYWFAMPDSTSSGCYEITVTVMDESGNESEKKYLKFVVLQTDQPVISCTSPSAAVTQSLNPSDTLFFAGTITDDTDLASVKFILKDASDGSILYQLNFDLNGGSDSTWDFNEMNLQSSWLIMPAVSGTYECVLDVTDSDQNHSQQFFTIQVL